MNESFLDTWLISFFFFFRKPTEEDSEWPSYSRDEPKYFIFDAEKTGLGKGPRTTYCAFWNEFLPKLKGIPGLYQCFLIFWIFLRYVFINILVIFVFLNFFLSLSLQKFWLIAFINNTYFVLSFWFSPFFLQMFFFLKELYTIFLLRKSSYPFSSFSLISLKKFLEKSFSCNLLLSFYKGL